LWSTILWALGISHREKDPASLKKRQVKSALQYASVRLLIIDEFNNLSNAGKKAADLLAAIKGLSNDLKISIVAAGTQAAINALNSDPQMKSRFEPAPLDRWRLDAEYLRFWQVMKGYYPWRNLQAWPQERLLQLFMACAERRSARP